MSAPAELDSEALLLAAENLLQQRRTSEALAAFHHAESCGALADRCGAGRWMAYAFAGDYASAWAESDAIRARGTHDPNRFWHGEDVAGKRVIVRCLHGLGDAIQCLRYLPLLQARCASVVVEVSPALYELASCFDGMTEVITWGQQAPATPPAYDVQMEIVELPYVFRTEEAHLPLATRYVRPPADMRACVGVKMAATHRPRVGLVWAASEWDLSRCLPFALAERFARTTGIEWWNMQGGAERERGDAIGLRDARLCGSGLANYASVLERMDLLITVDTMAAHLAGAMSKPAWLLLQFEADWRWMLGRADTPWYPSLRLWRQRTQGDWDDLATRVEAGLQQWLATRSAPAEAQA